MIVSEHLGLKFLSFITSKYSNKCVHHRVLGYGLGASRIVMRHVENAEINLFYKDN